MGIFIYFMNYTYKVYLVKENLNTNKIKTLLIVLIVPIGLGLVQNVYGNNNTNNFTIYTSDSKPYGHPYGYWTSNWWQWLYGIPKDHNPGYDKTGENCNQYQSGPVWYLAGVFGNGHGGSAELLCTIPAGKSILFPIIDWECSYAENGLGQDNYTTAEGLRACAKSGMDKVFHLSASIDGVEVKDLQKYRVLSPLYNLTLPKNNVLGVKSGVTQSINDGFYIFLPPLSPGKHEITFRGLNVEPQENFDFYVEDIIYHLTVK
jgi:hypothetical protein